MLAIYTHPNCDEYALSPLKMFTHLQTAHRDSTTITLKTLGARGLDAQLVKQRIHLVPHPRTRVYPCIACNRLFFTSFEAHAHLVHAPVHAADVAGAIGGSGEAGVAALITTAWLEVLDEHVNPVAVVKNKFVNEVHVNEEQGQLV